MKKILLKLERLALDPRQYRNQMVHAVPSGITPVLIEVEVPNEHVIDFLNFEDDEIEPKIVTITPDGLRAIIDQFDQAFGIGRVQFHSPDNQEVDTEEYINKTTRNESDSSPFGN